MPTFSEYKKKIGVKLPQSEIVNLLDYSFPGWKKATGTDKEQEISLFLYQFGWTLAEVNEKL